MALAQTIRDAWRVLRAIWWGVADGAVSEVQAIRRERLTRSEWRRCAAAGHHWRHFPISADPHTPMVADDGTPIWYWSCGLCRITTWAAMKPAPNYYREPYE